MQVSYIEIFVYAFLSRPLDAKRIHIYDLQYWRIYVNNSFPLRP